MSITGGYPGPEPAGVAYKLTGSAWSEVGVLVTPRGWHACSYRGDYLYVMGGYNGSYLSSTEVLDLTTGEWSAGPDLPYPAYDGRAVQYDGELYLVGGYGSGGRVVRLSAGGDMWEVVDSTAGGIGTREWAPAAIISSDIIGC